jgi:hypothetical protein
LVYQAEIRAFEHFHPKVAGLLWAVFGFYAEQNVQTLVLFSLFVHYQHDYECGQLENVVEDDSECCLETKVLQSGHFGE